MVIAFAIRDWISGGVTFVFVLNVFVSTIQEFTVEQTVSSSKKLSSPTASVLRDGKEVMVRRLPSRLKKLSQVILFS